MTEDQLRHIRHQEVVAEYGSPECEEFGCEYGCEPMKCQICARPGDRVSKEFIHDACARREAADAELTSWMIDVARTIQPGSPA